MTDPIPKLDINDLRTYRAHWQRVGPMLARIRREEARRMTPRERQKALCAALELVPEPPPLRTSSGLLEYCRLMRKRFG